MERAVNWLSPYCMVLIYLFFKKKKTVRCVQILEKYAAVLLGRHRDNITWSCCPFISTVIMVIIFVIVGDISTY